MRRFAALLTLLALAFIPVACGGDDEPAAKTDPSNTTTQDEPAKRPIEVVITADGFNPAAAEVLAPIGDPGIRFNNNDSKPHTIKFPDGQEQLVKAGATFHYFREDEGCCAATFTDKGTGAKFQITAEFPESASP